MKLKVPTPAGDIVIDASRMDLAVACRAAKLITQNIAGKRLSFTGIATPKATPFFERCWRACRTIPVGETRTYRWLATAAGSPLAIRAAGQAMRRNPLPMIVPCHRVVAANGLGGFAGSNNPRGKEMKLKLWLLQREGWIQGVQPVEKNKRLLATKVPRNCKATPKSPRISPDIKR
ncbi:MAG: MGMT family protein [Phycisphaerales bacterium]|nr:MGMT family protein [Phycisphaerales bacterium]